MRLFILWILIGCFPSVVCALSFDTAIQPIPLKTAKTSKAVQAYLNKLNAPPNSRFDQYLRGNQSILTPAEKQGYALFQSYGCVSCHQGLGVGGNIMGNRAIYAQPNTKTIRVPSLRKLKPPYLQDGSAKTLEEAIEHMQTYQLGHTLPKEDIQLIIKFLQTLQHKK